MGTEIEQSTFDDIEEPEDDSSGDGREMTLWEHLEDLRWVILKCATAFLIAFLLVVSFLPTMADWLRWPLDYAFGSAEKASQILVTRTMFDVFSVIIQVAFVGSLALSLPFLLYFSLGFVAPGLTEKERKMMLPVVLLAVFSFLVGAAFAYGIILPATLSASIFFNQLLDFEQMWSPGTYYTTVVWFMIMAGLVFELPLLVGVLVHLEVVEVRHLTDNWRVIFTTLLIVAAIASPGGDPVSFIFVALPLLMLYGISILGGRWVERRKRKAESGMRKLEG